jgi:sugar-specific transcriptional regulator TrmB
MSSDCDKAINGVAKVINNSTQEVLIVSGAFAHEIYGSSQVSDAINNALQRGVHFDVIVGPDYDNESKSILDRLGDVCTAPDWPAPHFVVGDRRHIRYEPRHDKIPKTPAAKNIVELNIPQAAMYLVEKFHQLKLQCESIKQLSGSHG